MSRRLPDSGTTVQASITWTIDGSGPEGVFRAAFLATVDEAIGEPIADYSELIVRISTGGIIAVGLGLSTKEILDFHVDRCPQIFCTERLPRYRCDLSLHWDKRSGKD